MDIQNVDLKRLLMAQRTLREESEKSVPEEIQAEISGETMRASNVKRADWKQILENARRCEKNPSDLKEHFSKLKELLESEWRGNALKFGGGPTAAIQPPPEKVRTGAAPSGHEEAAATFRADGISPESLSALARLLAPHMPEAVAAGQLQLQNGGVGDQLPRALDDRLQRIEASQEKLLELAVTEYIKANGDSVRSAAIKKHWKVHRHEPAFVAEAKMAYASAHEEAIRAEAARVYMKEHEDEEDFREEAAQEYVAQNQDCEELRAAAAKLYKEEHEDDDDFVKAAEEKYIEENKDEVREEAAKLYKEEHEDDDDFVEAAKKKYIEEHESEIQEAAAEKYKEEHKGEASFKREAARLLADAM